LARHATVPVINGLSDLEHPCQALADLFTLWERGVDLGKTRLAWIGDGNNVCTSLLYLAALTGVTAVVASPPGFEPPPAVLDACRGLGGASRHHRGEGCGEARTPFTPTVDQRGRRRGERQLEAFQRYQLNDRLWASPSPGAVMHCPPPTRRGDHRRRPRRAAQLIRPAEARLRAEGGLLHPVNGGWAVGGGRRHERRGHAMKQAKRSVLAYSGWTPR
jgi:ornithine carbamoyltransferase